MENGPGENNNKRKQRLPNFFELAKESLTLYEYKWVRFLQIGLLGYAGIIAIALASLVLGLIIGTATIIIKNILILLITAAIAIIIVLAGIIFFSSWLAAANIIILRNEKENLTWRDTMKQSKPFALPYLATSIFSGLILLANFAFFIIPGFIFLIWLAFSSYIVVIENKRGLDAIAKSREYIRGYFWNVLLLMLIGSLIMQIIFSAIKPLIVIPFLYPIAAILVAPLGIIYNYLIYKHLRELKGEIIVPDNSTQKNIYAVMAGIGGFIVITIIGAIIYFAAQINELLKTEIQRNPAQPFEQLLPKQ